VEVEPPFFRSQVEPGKVILDLVVVEVEPPFFRSQVEPGNEGNEGRGDTTSMGESNLMV